MVSSRVLILSVTAALAALTVGPAAAQTLHNTEVTGTLVDQNGVSSHFDDQTRFSPTFANSSRNAQNYSVDGNSSDNNHGLVSAQVIMSSPEQNTSNGGFASFLSGTASLSYIMGLSSTNPLTLPNGLVPVQIGASGGIQWNWDGTALGEFLVRNSRTLAVVVDEKLGPGPGLDPIHGSESFTLDQTFDLDPTQTYQVFLSASASGFLNSIDPSQPDGMEVTASIDPTFAVVGDFASHWSLTGIPVDTSVASGAPEPATWATLIAGFGLAGAVLRRRRQALAA